MLPIGYRKTTECETDLVVVSNSKFSGFQYIFRA